MPLTVADTVRLDILRYVKTLYEAAIADPTPDPVPSGKKVYGLAFSTVEIGPLGGEDNRRQYSIGIVPGKEVKSDLYPLKTAMCPLDIEFRVTINKGDERPGIVAEQVLGIVQQVLYDDNNLGGKVIKCDEQGSELDLLTYQDRSVSGVAHFMIHYRHHGQNVYDPNPSI